MMDNKRPEMWTHYKHTKSSWPLGYLCWNSRIAVLVWGQQNYAKARKLREKKTKWEECRTYRQECLFWDTTAGCILGEGNGKKELKKKIPSQEKGKALLPKALAELSFINIYKAFRDSQMEGTADMTEIIIDLKRSNKQTEKDFK